ncbi:MAG: choice-of-anchor Q domain-containing protein [Pyrinomonadaceae bacterium]
MMSGKSVLRCVLIGFVFVALTISAARAANFTVNNNADTSDVAAGNGICADTNGNCTLRAAVEEANALAGGDAIDFAASLTNETITLTSEIVIANNGTLTINGLGANVLTINGGAGTNRIFSTNAATVVTIKNVTLTGGNGTGATANGSGGAIYANGGTLVLDGVFVAANTITPQFTDGGGVYFNGGSSHQIVNSTFSGNVSGLSGNCGGFFNSGTLTVTNSTISGNSALPTGNGGGFGGGFCSRNNTTLRNVTVSGNFGGNTFGGGIYHSGGTLNLANSIVAGNTEGQGIRPDIYFDGNGAVTTSGYNLIGDNSSVAATFPAGNPNANNDIVGTNAAPINPRLAPLGNYGGATFTHALLQNSPALDAGNNCVLTANGCGNGNAALSFDQRGTGAPRKIGAAVDIGAYERNITFDQSTLPNGNTGVPYNQTLTAARQTSFAEFGGYEQTPDSPAAPFTFSIIPIAGQQLPPGLSLASNGTISGTPTQTGTFTFTVKAADADTMAGAQQYTIQITAPTAASVSVSGRVLTPTGRGLSNAFVVLTDMNGDARTTRTSSFGYYRFDDVAAGETYIMSVRSKRFSFVPRVVTVTEELNDLNFTAEP